MTKITPEQRVSRGLRAALAPILEETNFIESFEHRDVLIGLEYFLPPILAEVYPYWKSESFDGFYLSEARKIGSFKATMRGVCVLITDQTITPFQVLMRVSPSHDEIDWMECCVGKRGRGKGDMERVPWSRWQRNSYSFLLEALQPIDWTYKVKFGEERD